MKLSLPLLQLQPDELVSGYLGRLGLRLGLEWKSSDMRYRLYQRIRELGYQVDYDLFSIAELFSGKARRELVEHHSITPFSHAFTTNGEGRAFADVPSRGEYCAREILGLFNKPKACPYCVRADLQEYGFSYWRRIHQMPGALHCPHHDVPLKTVAAHFPYYRQPHHILATLTPDNAPHEVSRAFHDRMTQIWLSVLAARRSSDKWCAIHLVRDLYSESWPKLWYVVRRRIRAASQPCSLELSHFKRELGAARQAPYEARVLVAALAASSVEVPLLNNYLRRPTTGDRSRMLTSLPMSKWNFTPKLHE